MRILPVCAVRFSFIFLPTWSSLNASQINFATHHLVVAAEQIVSSSAIPLWSGRAVAIALAQLHARTRMSQASASRAFNTLRRRSLVGQPEHFSCTRVRASLFE